MATRGTRMDTSVTLIVFLSSGDARAHQDLGRFGRRDIAEKECFFGREIRMRVSKVKSSCKIKAWGGYAGA